MYDICVKCLLGYTDIEGNRITNVFIDIDVLCAILDFGFDL